MKHPISSKTSVKSLFVSLAVSLLAAAPVAVLWGAGLLDSFSSAFVLGAAQNPSTPPQTWVALLLIAVAAAGAGAAVERAGGRRAVIYAYAALTLLCGASLAASRFLHIDILFAPVMLAAQAALVLVQWRRLWAVDALLTAGFQNIAAHPSKLEGRAAGARLASGLKLLDTVLPLDEAVIFRLDDCGVPVQAARLRAPSQAAGSAPDGGRNAAWREGVGMCERAIRGGEMMVKAGEGQEGGSTVALALRHEGRAVGALLLRLRDAFDEDDRPLLSNVSAQFARDLQRDRARALDVPKTYETFFSARAAEQRLESLGVLSGLLTEQGFAGRVLAESSEAHAVAYLDGTLAYVNRRMQEDARLTADQCRSLDLFGLLGRFRTGVFDEPAIAVRRVLQTGQAYERELNFADREQTLALRIALVTSGEGEDAVPLCLSVTARDVTQMKEFETLKSDMLSLMSHELRTPITSINGFAELLMADESIPEEPREFLSIINSESQRLTRMIGTFLSVAKLEQKDRQEVLMSPVLLDDVVRETVGNFQPTAKRKRMRLIETNGTKLPPVAADRSLITQALSNLVDNAIKYSPERTAVTLSTALEADAVRVTVEDRGYGIPIEDQDKVWEKFYRVSRDGRIKEEESTGLGLSFVRQVVEQHGGQVFLESEVGRGSRVGFTLPRL